MILNQKKILNLLYPLLIVLWILIFSRQNFAQGFDFTDSTLTYHFSLKVLEGFIPFKDFHTTVLPFTYYVGAFFHLIFGKSLLVNNYAGLACLIAEAILVYLIIKEFVSNKFDSFILTLFLITLLYVLQESIFLTYKPLAYALALLSIYLSIISLTKTNLSFITGVTSFFTFFTLQSLGLAIIIAYVSFLGILYIYDVFDRKLILRIFLKYFIGLLLFSIPIIIYYSHHQVLEEIKYILLTSSERKGLSNNNFLQIFNSLYPAIDSKTLKATLLFSIFLIIALVKFTKRYLLFTYVLISLLGVISYFQTGGIVSHIALIIFFESPKIIMTFFIIYYIFSKSKKSYVRGFLLTIMIAAAVFVMELSWPGPGYKLTVFSGIYLYLLPFLSLKSINIRSNLFKFISLRFVLVLINIIFLVFNLISPKKNIYREFEPDTIISLPPYLNNRTISSRHKMAIDEIKKNYDNYCLNKKTFIFSWAPILYDLLETDNPTKYDMPNHDWITLREGQQIINKLRNNPPCFLILDEESTFNEKRKYFFPAKGMKAISKFLREELLKEYKFIQNFETKNKNFYIFYKN